jgi:hypothetical protein
MYIGNLNGLGEEEIRQMLVERGGGEIVSVEVKSSNYG